MLKPASALQYYLYNAFVTHIPFYWVRHRYLRSVLRIKMGNNCAVHTGCFFTGRLIAIGHNTVINRNCYLDGRIGIEIGGDVSLSPETCIISLDHDPASIDFATRGEKVVLDDYVWTGMRAVILPGVHLGKGCVAGAGAVVTKSFGDFTVVAGNPAKKIGERNRDLKYELNYRPYFNTDILPDKR
ncbi:MAG TPA: acyltransferase [Chitinivibrionales bacterium]|nr:acyltransferase [Chitinivibrionales bacterium]